MQSRLFLLLPLIASLAACGTPQERCIAQSTRDLQTVRGLVAQTEANLARGYGYQSVQVRTTNWEICDWVQTGTGANGKPVVRPRYCLEDDIETVQKPVAIDPVMERRKLEALKQKEAQLNRASAPAVAECRARFPE